MSNFAAHGAHGMLLEAEVAPRVQARFQHKYQAVTGQAVTPGNPVHYQSQPNKWGEEVRVYFNDPGVAVTLTVDGYHVENSLKAYQGQNYRFRVNSKKLWWALVEHHGFRLGIN
jgi:hypothetical protein